MNKNLFIFLQPMVHFVPFKGKVIADCVCRRQRVLIAPTGILRLFSALSD
jgi:hypothetical protein